MPTLSNSQIDQQVTLSDAPGSDFSFDDLFGTPGETSNRLQPPQAAAPEQPLATPQAAPAPAVTPVDEPFLRASSGSVYKTREEAERGISAKDTTIESLRRYAIEKTGFDPLTGKPVQQPQVTAPAPSEGKVYWDELVDAANKGDYQRYSETQRKFTQQIINEALAPVAPLISEVARQRAVSSVARSNSEVQQWVGSAEYDSFLGESPVLRTGIENAERNPQLFEQLPELYKIAHLAYQGRRLPDILRQQQQNNPAAPPTQPTTTVAQSTTTPPAPSQYVNQSDALRSREGRREIIERFERSGAADRDLTSFR